MDKIFAPFTFEQTENLNRFQQNGIMHPFTCGGERTDKWHLDGEGVLLATRGGWLCLFCGYKQDWCWEFMTKDQPEKDERFGFRSLTEDEIKSVKGFEKEMSEVIIPEMIKEKKKL
jgi:hypothetical protein